MNKLQRQKISTNHMSHADSITLSLRNYYSLYDRPSKLRHKSRSPVGYLRVARVLQP